MRGFVAGTLALVVLGAVVQPTASKAVEQGGNWFISGLRRFLSPDVAGIPQRKGG